MRICETAAALRLARAGAPGPVGFFPTMGALHDGHMAIVRRCRAENATTIVSVFVNPTQFDRGGDFDAYPRDLDADAALLRDAGVDLLFAPSPAAMYPAGFATSIDVGPLARQYEGAHRPGHFAGVCTVVAKLFGIVQPDRAYFGRKDAQQLAVLRAMVRDLDMPAEIVPCETVREPDGLALSSRNVHLDAAGRARARGLSEGLFRARDAWGAGERDPARLAAVATAEGLDYDYLACVNPRSFGPPAPDGPALMIAAAWVGKTRLIDNLPLGE